MIQVLNIDKDKEKDIKNDKKEPETIKQKKEKSPVNNKENNKSPVNKKIEKVTISKSKKESTEEQSKKKIPIPLKKNEFVIKKDNKDNNKFKSAAQKIQYAPIKKKELAKRKSNESSILKEKVSKEKESNQTTFLDKSIQTNIRKKNKKKPQKDEQSVVHSEDFQASSEFTATENENKQKHYKMIIPHRKYKRESRQSGQSTNNEIINEGKQEQSFFEKSSSLSSNKLPFKHIIPKSKLFGSQKRSTSTCQCDQKSTPSTISGCGTPFPGNASKRMDKSYTNSTSFLQNRLVQTAKAESTRNFEQNSQLFEINSSKIRINKNASNPTFDNNCKMEESKCRRHLPRGPRLPFSNISQDYIDRRK